MRVKINNSKVISLKGRRFKKKYKAFFAISTKIKMFFTRKTVKPSAGINYRKTINN